MASARATGVLRKAEAPARARWQRILRSLPQGQPCPLLVLLAIQTLEGELVMQPWEVCVGGTLEGGVRLPAYTHEQISCSPVPRLCEGLKATGRSLCGVSCGVTPRTSIPLSQGTGPSAEGRQRAASMTNCRSKPVQSGGVGWGCGSDIWGPGLDPCPTL